MAQNSSSGFHTPPLSLEVTAHRLGMRTEIEGRGVSLAITEVEGGQRAGSVSQAGEVVEVEPRESDHADELEATIEKERV